MPKRHRVVLLGHQTHVVAQVQEALGQLDRLVLTPDAVQRLDQPERADQEDALGAGEAVTLRRRNRRGTGAGTVLGQLPLDRLGRAVNPGPTDVDLNPADGPNADTVNGLTALGHYATPTDIAAA